MKHTSCSITVTVVTIALMLSAAVVINAQNREKFVISAKAGGVNAITGRAEVRAKHGGEWQLLSVTDDLKSGDIVKTGSDGRLEMLLNPGSYLRVAENSEFELTDGSLENLEVRLSKGTAIIEATGSDHTELMINVSTPHARMAIVRSGLYRLNVVPGDATELIVRKGRVLLDNSQTKVKSGKKVVFTGNTFSVAKLGKADKQTDDLEGWSKQRAEMLAQANRGIRGRDASLLLASLYGSSYAFSAGSLGLWFFNPGFGCSTFLPFYFGWGSPYGSWYGNVFFPYCHYCGGSRGYTGPAIVTVPRSTTGPSRSTTSSGATRPWGSGSRGSDAGSSTGTRDFGSRTPSAPVSTPSWPASGGGREPASGTGRERSDVNGGKPRPPE